MSSNSNKLSCITLKNKLTAILKCLPGIGVVAFFIVLSDAVSGAVVNTSERDCFVYFVPKIPVSTKRDPLAAVCINTYICVCLNICV